MPKFSWEDKMKLSALTTFIERDGKILICYGNYYRFERMYGGYSKPHIISAENAENNDNMLKHIFKIAHEYGHYLSLTLGYWNKYDIGELTEKEINWISGKEKLFFREKIVLILEEMRAWYLAFGVLKKLKIKLPVLYFASVALGSVLSYFIGYFNDS